MDIGAIFCAFGVLIEVYSLILVYILNISLSCSTLSFRDAGRSSGDRRRVLTIFAHDRVRSPVLRTGLWFVDSKACRFSSAIFAFRMELQKGFRVSPIAVLSSSIVVQSSPDPRDLCAIACFARDSFRAMRSFAWYSFPYWLPLQLLGTSPALFGMSSFRDKIPYSRARSSNDLHARCLSQSRTLALNSSTSCNGLLIYPASRLSSSLSFCKTQSPGPYVLLRRGAPCRSSLAF